MTDRELMQMALDALEKLNKDGWILADFEDEVYASIEALRDRLAQPENAELPLVRVEEFIKLIEGKEDFRGIPVMRTEWPTRNGYE